MYSSLIEIPISISRKYPNRVSHRFRYENGLKDITYSEFVNDIMAMAIGFNSFGINPKDHVAFFVNNRYEWSLTDFALQSISAVSVPRGSDTTPKEAEFIFKHSDSTILIIENINQLNDIKSIVNMADIVFIIDEGEIPESVKSKVIFYRTVLKHGRSLIENDRSLYQNMLEQVKKDDIVSIIYTSGTTGNPKGVILTQEEFISNVIMTAPRMNIDESMGEVTVTVLPAWHVFERTFEYSGLSCGLSFVYSSIRTFSQDILREQPHILASVPRLWDSIYGKMKSYMKSQPKKRRDLFNFLVKYNFRYKKQISYIKNSVVSYKKDNLFVTICKKVLAVINILSLFSLHIFAERVFKGVREKVGGRLRCAISGGGSLPVAVDQFFASVGIHILNAYGMTECSPGIMSRTIKRNTLGSIGTPFPGTSAKIVNENGVIVNRGEKGVLLVKGPQVMSGYYKNSKATKEILDGDGWLNTGDLAKQTIYGEYVLVGRSKDTIVLLGGENVDPLPIEDKIQESDMIDHVMLLGQDKKGLTAFIALNDESLAEFASSVKVKISQIFKPKDSENGPSDEYRALERKIKDELDEKISRESGFKHFERITKVILVKNTFKIGKELTQTLKIKRKQIMEKYHSLISKNMDEGR